ncbi:MAG: family 43 glycosylhydrolase [Bacteroidales bacterium]|nr:family 43 glycosylhydrolase [Bacteroidales bacterium]
MNNRTILKSPSVCLSWLFIAALGLLGSTSLVAQVLKLHYGLKTDQVGSSTVIDESGNGYNATLLNGAKIADFNGTRVIDLGSANGYVNIGAQFGSVIASLHNFSFVAKIFVPSATDISGDGNFVWSFANSTNIATDANGCLFYSLKTGRFAISPDNWTSEQTLNTANQLPKAVWKTIIYTQNEGLAKILIDGVLVKSGNITISPSQLGATPYNYLGRSCYTADAYLKDAKIADFRVYDGALSFEQIEQLSGVTSVYSAASVLAKYYFSSLKDSSGKYTGSLNNGAVLDSYSGLSVLSLGGANGYFNFGAGFGAIVSQLDSFSISSNLYVPNSADIAGSGNFVWTFANSTDMTNTANGNLFFTAGRSRYAISKTHYAGEYNVLSDNELPKGRWINLTYTQRKGVGKIFINGSIVAQAAVPIIPKELGATAYNFIGRSCYNGDNYLKSAMVDNFIVYRGALHESDILKQCKSLIPLNNVLDSLLLIEIAKTLVIPNANEIGSHIELVSEMGTGVTVSWQSVNANVISSDGLITRPPKGSAAVQVELTATLHLNNVSINKKITVTILPAYSDAESIQYDIANLTLVGDTDNLKTAIHLPTITPEGSMVVWQSDSPEYLSNEGLVVQLSPAGMGKKQVTLTATLINGTQSATKSFTVWVAEDEGFSAYLFAYFTGNDAAGEQIRFAVSNNGIDYTPLNNGQRIMSSDTISLKKGVRDPHILRGNDGKTFYMVATDMKSSEGWSSNRGIVMLKSTDLVNWKHATVNFPTKWPSKWGTVIRVWAPQTIYDPVAGRYLVYFSLRTSDATCPYDKIYYCYANDNFTDLLGEPKFLFDRGSATIDGDIVYSENERLYYLFFKNESMGGISQVTSKTLTEAAGQNPGSQWSSPSANLQQTTKAVEGAGVFKLINKNEWVLMYDCYVDGHYQFCTSTDLKNFKFAQDNYNINARHGTTIPITEAEANRLVAKWPATALSGRPLGARNTSILPNGCTIDHTNKTISLICKYGINVSNFNPMLYAAPGTVISPNGNTNFSNGGRNYTFTINNTTLSYMVTVKTSPNPLLDTVNLELLIGWNLVSLSVNPTQASVKQVFPNATKVKTTDVFFDSSVADFLNSLRTVEGGKAYLVYNSKNETVGISGLRITPKALHLNSGWNLYGSNSSQKASLENIFGDELINVKTIKNFSGFWNNSNAINSINSINPGNGYYILK